MVMKFPVSEAVSFVSLILPKSPLEFTTRKIRVFCRAWVDDVISDVMKVELSAFLGNLTSCWKGSESMAVVLCRSFHRGANPLELSHDEEITRFCRAWISDLSSRRGSNRLLCG